jgi:predicted enzyme related to lactoylglutathione lyase
MKVLRVRSWNLNADKFQDTIDFYRSILGAEDRTFNQVRGADVSRVRLGNMVVGIFDAESGARPGVPHHTFDIEGPEDSEDAVKELEGMGIEVQGVRVHNEDSGYSIYVNDPSGNRLELSTSPPQS